MLPRMFHPAVSAWFERRFPEGATPAQLDGWAAIAAGHDTLIAAPTGSGKTLAAFLVCIDRQFRAVDASGSPAAAAIDVVYVSPLKALAVDIHHNLETPLAEIRALAVELGLGQTVPEVRVALRTSDTPAYQRTALWKRPPHILVTTPESLYLLLTAARSREALRTVRTVIVDEIHALARDKRGAHLALSLERLEHVCAQRPTRIGLSATQRPIERIARLLVGGGAAPARACTVVDTGHRRALDLAIELPDSELEAVASTEQTDQVLDKIAEHARQRRTTLVFVNTRRMAERLAHQLGERLGELLVAAHHGSLAKDRRQRIESRLRSGELRVVVATASLELGIDIGPVELVCQIGSPRNIATLLQRVGRSGHTRFGMPVGRLYPLTRDELVECAALLRSVRCGELDAIVLPETPLDVLAQQIVAECAAEDWHEDALFELARRALHYQSLTRAQFDEVVCLVTEGVLTGRGRRAAYLHRDRVGNRLSGRRGARLAALTSGGAIPETADYRVVAEPDDTPVGTINEDFAIESMVGDVFLLGSTSWRIRRVQPGVVRVIDAQGATPTVPFWLGEAPARSAELSSAVSELRIAVDARLAESGESAAADWLIAEAGVSAVVAREIVAYLAATRAALGVIPNQRDLTFERFFDETGGMQLVVHAPFGGRINRALGLLLRKRFCTSFDFELQAAASDDAIVLSLGPQHSFALEDLPGFLRPGRVREALVHAVIVTPMFAVRWRWNLNRALTVLRWKGGKKNPPPLQRMESDDVMVALFPALAACQDNAQGPREIPDHVLVRQTLHDCLHEAMDLPALEALLLRIERAEVLLHFRDTTEPSPLSHEILNSRPYTFLDDAPLEERRTRAVQLRRGLPVNARELAALDPEAIARVRAEVRCAPRDAAELHDALLECVVLRPRPGCEALFDALVLEQRAFAVQVTSGTLWCARENRREVTLLFPHASVQPDLPLLAALSAEPEPTFEAAAERTVRGYLDCAGPTTLAELALGTGLSSDVLAAALARVEGQGFALRGHFDAHESAEQYCARRLLGRIHVYTQKRLRREIEPVTAQDFMRFVLRHQGAEPGHRRQGSRGVLAVIEQLQGYELAAAAWEVDVLAARVEGYRPEWLDALCMSGQVTWGRGSLPGARSEESRGALLSRATPITLAIRDDFPWLLASARSGMALTAPACGETARVLECLAGSGALFLSQLVASTGLHEAQVRDALWDGVARGLVTADGFEALRRLLAPRAPAVLLPRTAADRLLGAAQRRSALRRGAHGAAPSQGRWSLLAAAAESPDRDALAEAVAEQLVARWGVVFRDVVAGEHLALPWREIVWALRRLEARGILRGGHFVAGFVGEQYALPEAVELLRAVRKAPRPGTLVRISACDPLNLTGVIVKGVRVPALRTHEVTYCDGVPLAASASAQVHTKRLGSREHDAVGAALGALE
jgi:ATP-dependent Lhr-like helicase